MLTDNLSVRNGHLFIGDTDTVELAKRYSTPLYVMDENQIRKNCKIYYNSMKSYYDGNGLVCYASKAFSCKAIYTIAKQEGLGVDVVSQGELYTALSVGFPAEKICFHGNNKTEQELIYAIDNNVGRIVVDNIDELQALENISKKLNKKTPILFRIKPGVDAHTHDFVKTGQFDSKFGLDLVQGMQAVKMALSMENIIPLGVHCHIGSQIFDIEPFSHAARILLEFIASVKKECEFEMLELNLGGGFGIKYVDEHDPCEYDTYMREVSHTVKTTCKELDIKQPFIIIEPGRSIVGDAGITLYKVGSIKEVPNVRTYVSVDGGMCDNPRYALYKSEYTAIAANKADLPKDTIITLAGKCCESGDLIGEHMPLQKVEIGDIVAVLATGAYNYSMSMNYNRNLRPAIVMVNGNSSKVIVKRETLEDIIRNDLD